jgi:hypothetical protein
MKRSVFCSGSVQPLYHASDHGQLAKGSFNASKRHRIFQIDLVEFENSIRTKLLKA